MEAVRSWPRLRPFARSLGDRAAAGRLRGKDASTTGSAGCGGFAPRWWRCWSGGLLIAGCAGQPVLYNHFINSGYSPTEFGVGAGRKDLRTVLHGDPFGVGEAEFAAATIALLNRHQPFLQPTHFTTTPGENASPRHRMVLIFDQPRIPVFQLCRAAPAGAAGRDPPSPRPSLPCTSRPRSACTAAS